MNEEMNKMLREAHSKITYSSGCLNAWADKLDVLFCGIFSDRSHSPYKPGMDEMERGYQAAYIWMEQNYDILASNIRMIDVLMDEADELLYLLEAAAEKEERGSKTK